MPELTPEQWVLLLGAAGALVASLAGSLKVLAEIAEIRARVIEAERKRSTAVTDAAAAVEEARTAAVEVRQQLNTNGGSSIRDAIDRIERRIGEVADEVGELRGELHADLRGVRRDIGRLAHEDISDREAAAKAHEQINARIDWLKGQVFGGRRTLFGRGEPAPPDDDG